VHAFHDGVRGHDDVVARRPQDRRVVAETECAGVGCERLEIARDQRVFTGGVVLAICHGALSTTQPSSPGLTGRSSIAEQQCLKLKVAEYWIIRWSLSSGGAPRRPGGG
jgi:hypothetical protein